MAAEPADHVGAVGQEGLGDGALAVGGEGQLLEDEEAELVALLVEGVGLGEAAAPDAERGEAALARARDEAAGARGIEPQQGVGGHPHGAANAHGFLAVDAQARGVGRGIELDGADAKSAGLLVGDGGAGDLEHGAQGVERLAAERPGPPEHRLGQADVELDGLGLAAVELELPLGRGVVDDEDLEAGV